MKNDELKIERGIPVPVRGKHGKVSDVFRKLKPGESVYIPYELAPNCRQLAYDVLGAGNHSVRTVEGGFRVWRK